MKRLDLIKKITALGAVFVRHGSDHDWYANHKTGVSQAVPLRNCWTIGLSKDCPLVHRCFENLSSRKIIFGD